MSDLHDINQFTATATARAQGTVQSVDQRVVYGGPPVGAQGSCFETISFQPAGHAPVAFQSHGRASLEGDICDPLHGTVTVLYDPGDIRHADTTVSLDSRSTVETGDLVVVALVMLVVGFVTFESALTS